jgi:hypothetical protein
MSTTERAQLAVSDHESRTQLHIPRREGPSSEVRTAFRAESAGLVASSSLLWGGVSASCAWCGGWFGG